MTHRSEHQQSPTEKAAAHVLDGINQLAEQAFTIHKPPMPREEFKRLLARVLDSTSENAWKQRLGIHTPEHEDEEH